MVSATIIVDYEGFATGFWKVEKCGRLELCSRDNVLDEMLRIKMN